MAPARSGAGATTPSASWARRSRRPRHAGRPAAAGVRAGGHRRLQPRLRDPGRSRALVLGRQHRGAAGTGRRRGRAQRRIPARVGHAPATGSASPAGKDTAAASARQARCGAGGATPPATRGRTPASSRCAIRRRSGPFTDWTAMLDVGQDSSCGIRADGSLWCWGSKTFGQLGVAARVEPCCGAAPGRHRHRLGADQHRSVFGLRREDRRQPLVLGAQRRGTAGPRRHQRSLRPDRGHARDHLPRGVGRSLPRLRHRDRRDRRLHGRKFQRAARPRRHDETQRPDRR